MVQRCKRFTGHFFTVILISVLLAGFGGKADGSSASDHAQKGHNMSEINRLVASADILQNIEESREIKLQGNVKNIDARKTRFELCSTTECADIDVSKNTSFMDVNGRASEFANLVENDYVTVTGRVRGEDNGQGMEDNDRDYYDVSHQSTVDAELVEIGNIMRYEMIEGAILSDMNDPAVISNRKFDIMDTSSWRIICVTVPEAADITLVDLTVIELKDLYSRQLVDLHGNYVNTCFSAEKIRATP